MASTGGTGSVRGRLPLELVQYVADELERANAKRTLASLSQASRPLHALVVPVLYRRIVLTRVNASRLLGLPLRPSPQSSGFHPSHDPHDNDDATEEDEGEYDPRDWRAGDALGSSVGEHLAAIEAEHVYSQRFRLPVDLAPTGDETDDEHVRPSSFTLPRPNPRLVHVEHLSLVQWLQPSLIRQIAASPTTLFPNARYLSIGSRAVARCPKLHEATHHAFLTQLARAEHVCVSAPASEAASDTGRLQWVVGCLLTPAYSPTTLTIHDCPAPASGRTETGLADVLGWAVSFGWPLPSLVSLHLAAIGEEKGFSLVFAHERRFNFVRRFAEQTRPRAPGPSNLVRLHVGGVGDAQGDPLWVARSGEEPAARRSEAELEAYLNNSDDWSNGKGGEAVFLPEDGDSRLEEAVEVTLERARTLTRRVRRIEARLDTQVDESAVADAERALAEAHERHKAALAELDASGPDTPKAELARLRDARHEAAVEVGMASRALKAVKAEKDRRAILARHDAGLKYVLEELHQAEDAAMDARYALFRSRDRARKKRLKEVPFPRGRIRLSADRCDVCGGETFGRRRSLKQIVDDAWAASARDWIT